MVLGKQEQGSSHRVRAEQLSITQLMYMAAYCFRVDIQVPPDTGKLFSRQ